MSENHSVVKESNRAPYGGKDGGFYRGVKNEFSVFRDLESCVNNGDLVALKTKDDSVYCLHFFGVSSEGAEFGVGFPYDRDNPGFFVDLTSGKMSGSEEVVMSYEVIKKAEEFNALLKKSKNPC